MPDQLDLIPEPVPWWKATTPVARNTDPPTSHEAADSMVDAAGAQQSAILDALRSWGPMNHSQLDDFLGYPAHTSNRRLPELRRMGLVERTGAKTLTSSGRQAYVYRITGGTP